MYENADVEDLKSLVYTIIRNLDFQKLASLRFAVDEKLHLIRAGLINAISRAGQIARRGDFENRQVRRILNWWRTSSHERHKLRHRGRNRTAQDDRFLAGGHVNYVQALISDYGPEALCIITSYRAT